MKTARELITCNCAACKHKWHELFWAIVKANEPWDIRINYPTEDDGA